MPTDRFPSLQKLLTLITEKSQSASPAHIRMFRGAMNLIPYVGSWLDVMTISAIQDELLEKRLRTLEDACFNALKASSSETAMQEFLFVGQKLFQLITAYQEEIFSENRKLLAEIRSFLAVSKRSSESFSANENFIFVIISGPSAVGKDTILDLLVRASFPNNIRGEILKKYSTRPRRTSDHTYYRFVTDASYKRLQNNGDILFPYSKREYLYGFDKKHFLNAATKECILFCIFTEFDLVPIARQYLSAQGFRNIAILMVAAEDDLIHRSMHRNLKDIRSRILSVRQDAQYIRLNKDYLHKIYDVIIESGDDYSKHAVLYEIVKYISDQIQASIDDKKSMAKLKPSCSL